MFNTQSRAEFDANWDRQLGCPAQYDPAVRQAVWTEMLASDPVKGQHLGIIMLPGVFLAITVFAINTFGDGLRDSLDPRMQRRV